MRRLTVFYADGTNESFAVPDGFVVPYGATSPSCLTIESNEMSVLININDSVRAITVTNEPKQ